MANSTLKTLEAPIYLGGKREELWFIDDSWNPKRDDFDYYLFISLIAYGIGENHCPTEAQWAEFCITSAITMAVTSNPLITIPKLVSVSDVEKYSWDKFWGTFGDRSLSKGLKVLKPQFVEALLRIFIPRHHYVDGPDRPYNESYFITRWSGTFSYIPDCSNDKICNVRLYHLKKGKELFKTFSEEIQKNIELVSGFIPPILKKVNIAIKE